MAGIANNAWTLHVGKQTAKGTPNTATGRKLRYTGGVGEPNPVRNILTLAETDAARQEGSRVVVGVRVEGTTEHYIRPGEFHTLADLLLGQTNTTGTTDYTHTATSTASGSAPYATLVKALNTTVLVDQYNDCQISSMTARGGAEQALTCSCDWLGLAAVLGATDSGVAVLDQAPLVYPNVTATLGGSTADIVDSFEIVATQNRTLIIGDTGTSASDIIAGQFAVSGSLSLLFEDDDRYRAFHTGATSGTQLGTTIFAESLSIAAVVSATLSVTWTIANVEYTAYPVAGGTDGAPIRVAATFGAKRAATLGDKLTIVTKNQVATP